ncbi:hypothetical protein FQR65_LT06146 [Abscondita terminalis]|nr:hypothetical protein FQR65_LT06146 [Abscondita terminalis]
MKIALVVFFVVWDAIHASNHTHEQNITKRGVNDQVTYYTDPIQVRIVHAPVFRDVPPTNTPLYINPKLIENEYPKQVTVQQVLYDYNPQQVASSGAIPDHVQAPSHFNQHPNVVTPVQHGTIINHGQSYSKYLYPVAVPQTTHAPLYPYANRVIYPRPNPYPQQPAPAVTQKPFKPSPLIYISKPVAKATAVAPAAVKEETDEYEKPHKSKVNKEEDDDNEELENYEDEEDEYKFDKYRYDDDDEDVVRGRYRDDDDDDNPRSYSRDVVRRKPRKPSNSNKYSLKSHYKNNRPSSYPKSKKDALETRQTQNIPVVHKHNSFREEKWIVTKKDE